MTGGSLEGDLLATYARTRERRDAAASAPKIVEADLRFRRAAERVMSRRRQAANLRALLSHAARTTEYYAYAAELDAHSLDDFDYLSRDDLAGRFAALLSTRATTQDARVREVPRGRAYLTRSSGTTGTPVSVLRGYDSLLGDVVSQYRLSMPAWHQPGDVWSLAPRGPRDVPPVTTMLNGGLRCVWNLPRLDPGAADYAALEAVYRAALEAGAPAVIVGPPSRLHDLMSFLASIGATVRSGVVVSSYEMLSPEDKEALSRSFGCAVRNWYGSAELGSVAMSCDAADALHVLPECAVVESAPGDEPTPPLAITALNSTRMPLVRYLVGDHGQVRDDCACGADTVTITRLDGRLSHEVVGADGRRHSPYFLLDCLRASGFRGFQAVQRQAGQVLVHVREGTLNEAMAEDAVRRFDAYGPRLVRLSVLTGAKPVVSASGKVQQFVSLITDPPLAIRHEPLQNGTRTPYDDGLAPGAQDPANS